MPWFAFGVADELPGDQQVEDQGSACFDTDVLEQPLEILGNPELEVTFTCDKPVALLAVRLCDVWPDGESTLITRGLLNLCYSESKSKPQELVAGKSYTVKISLNHTGYVVPVGHQLRLAVSTSYWPMAWPTPYTANVAILTESSRLNLPLRQESGYEEKRSSFAAPVARDAFATTQLRKFQQDRTVVVDPESQKHQLKIFTDNGKVRFEDNKIEMASKCWQKYAVKADDPLSANAKYDWEWEFSRGDAWRVRTLTTTQLSSDENYFYLASEVTAWEQGKKVYHRADSERFERDHY